MKRIIILSIFASLFFSSALTAQQAKISDSLKKSFIIEKPLLFHLTAGTAYMTGFKKTGSMMSTFFAPELNYKLSKRFTLDAGLMVINSSYSLFHPTGEGFQSKPFSNNFTSTFLYAGGQYQLNDRITLSGQAYTMINTFGNKNNPNDLFSRDVKGLAFGMDYKISEHSTIGIQMNFSNGNSPFYYNSPIGLHPQNQFFGR